MLIDHPAEPGRQRPAGALGDLLARYAAYRRRQARRLLHMMPREAIRPIYREAVARLTRGSSGRPPADPMEAMVAYCERLLPLPPFDLWQDDVDLNPEAHLLDVDDSAEVPSAEAPATVESRGLSFGGREWAAHLRCFRDGAAWRGFIAFEDPGSTSVHRTALIFRESDPVEVRARFMDFDGRALSAFLRSALP